jgi:hypothetical protein
MFKFLLTKHHHRHCSFKSLASIEPTGSSSGSSFKQQGSSKLETHADLFELDLGIELIKKGSNAVLDMPQTKFPEVPFMESEV